MKYLVKKHGRTLSIHRKMNSAKKSLKNKGSDAYIVKRKQLYPRDK